MHVGNVGNTHTYEENPKRKERCMSNIREEIYRCVERNKSMKAKEATERMENG
jgi:hypothetical protein